jgi:Phycobilisome protein
MSNSRKSRGVCASPKGKELLDQARREGKDSEGNRLTYERIAEMASVADKTVRRFFKGENVDKSYATDIIKALGLDYYSVISLEEEKIEEAKIQIAERESYSPKASEVIRDLEAILQEHRKNTKIDNLAMEWLKGKRLALAEEAASVVLKEYSNQNLYDGEREYAKKFSELSKDIIEYLRICHICLQEGTVEVLQQAWQQSLIPSNSDPEVYQKALSFIKEKKVLEELPQEVGKSLASCLDYLIKLASL